MRLSIILATALLAVGCTGKTETNPKGAVGPQTVLARIDDMTITSADLKESLARYANQPYALARYSSIEKKKELLDSIIRYDVLVLEARKRGYERDPEVLRAAKDKMVRLFTQQEISDKIKSSDISDAEVEKYYKDHAAEFARPETVRASEIVLKERARALKVLAEVKALPKADLKAFRELVAKYSEDADSKQRGGDLTQFERDSTQYPQAVVASAFALKEIGDVSDPVKTDKGFSILKLTDKRPAVSRSLGDATLEIQRRLLDELRAKKKKDYIDAARKEMKVEIYEDQLAKLDIPALVGAPTQTPATDPAPRRGGVDAGAVLRIRL